MAGDKKDDLMSMDAQERLIEGARRGGEKGGKSPKHFGMERNRIRHISPSK